MLTSEVLQKARDLISDPKAWTKRALARDESGKEVSLYSGEAKCFCASGSIKRICNKEISPRNSELLIQEQINDWHLIVWNDDPERTHKEVLDAFDSAIKMAKSEGK